MRAKGTSIEMRLPKTTVKPGTAFRNGCVSADNLYSSNRDSLGYDVHRSLRGTSLRGTTKRFICSKGATSERVGPGSYDIMKKPKVLLSDPPICQRSDLPLSDRLTQWGCQVDSRSIDCAGEWKNTSGIPSVTKHLFRKAHDSTWIEQVEQRHRRENPSAYKGMVVCPKRQMPDYLLGVSEPAYVKAAASSILATQRSCCD
ncbi:uncharacterized protein PHALS_03887 [Plasmopara halstedii]|uniref:Uncharacterized protein n=1 Tax=Plasmopara halstedii TaxID=4781 RepID=A0A0P1B1H0_PLAHL|nr:uncharacterized protein PHALS_03887 [Plasmopara halstedii]CEG47240.1 hypothetical protein PHALS_03887 [Plasmopara halstedii]|eukprot:XP_024583609.1 hypothetical protein PHALS_03887 [Plasmopara halstedii]